MPVGTIYRLLRLYSVINDTIELLRPLQASGALFVCMSIQSLYKHHHEPLCGFKWHIEL